MHPVETNDIHQCATQVVEEAGRAKGALFCIYTVSSVSLAEYLWTVNPFTITYNLTYPHIQPYISKHISTICKADLVVPRGARAAARGPGHFGQGLNRVPLLLREPLLAVAPSRWRAAASPPVAEPQMDKANSRRPEQSE